MVALLCQRSSNLRVRASGASSREGISGTSGLTREHISNGSEFDVAKNLQKSEALEKMAASVTGRAINRDWEERDFVESMQVRTPVTGAARSRRHSSAPTPLTPPCFFHPAR